MLLISLLIAVTLSAAFLLKTNSTKGRWFICSRTAELVCEKPLTGLGTSGFDRQYMPAQGAYFKAHPGSGYALLADGIRHPLNEYLNIAVKFGLTGVAVLAVFLTVTLIYYLRHRSAESKVCALVLLSAASFSMFSYPFWYPFTWLVCLLSMTVIYGDLLRKTVRGRKARWLSGILLLCVASSSPCMVRTILTDMEWRRLSDLARYNASSKVMRGYARLYPEMRHNPYFLYNYSASAYEAGRYGEALSLARKCQEYYCDYDLEMLLADCCQALDNTDMALRHYHEAHYMIPSRLMPYYGEFEVYRQRNDIERCRQMAEMILAKPVKVKSQATQMIKDEVYSFIKEEKN